MQLYNGVVWTLFAFINLIAYASCREVGKVLEIDERLIDYATQGKWLVTFYAPWCGHCRKLEPVMEEVAKYYHEKLPITIAKIDATQFQKAANHFDIKAYPTIKFISGQKVINYFGERRKEDIISFISKADSPRVTTTLNQIDFEHIKTKHKHFFLLISSSKDQESQLKINFYKLANQYFLDTYFFHASPHHISKSFQIPETPAVGVMKENEFIQFNSSEQTIENFIKNERFLTFTEITMSNFQNLIEMQKTLIILNLNTQEKKKLKQTKALRQKFEMFSKEQRHINHNEFQFGYVDKSDLLNGIAIWTLPTPILFIFNTSLYTYGLIDLVNSKDELIDIDLQNLLDEIRQNKIEFLGGQSYLRTLRRPLWEIYKAVMEMFFEAPFLSLLIFGFPFSVISIVIYFLCCVDSSDSLEEEEFSDTDDEIMDEQHYSNDSSQMNADDSDNGASKKKTQ